jgi:hypothetical protein
MPRTGGLVRNRGPILGFAKRLVSGLIRFTESATDTDGDFAEFEIITGTTALADIAPATSGTRVLLPDVLVPAGMRCYITDLEIANQGAGWNGTAGSVSLTIEDTAGTDIITFNAQAITVGVYISGKYNGTAPTGVAGNAALLALQASTAVGRGIQATLANSSTGGAVRVRIAGYFAP